MDRASAEMARRLAEERAAGFAEGWRAAHDQALQSGGGGPSPRPKGWMTAERAQLLRELVPAGVPWPEIMRRLAEVSPEVRLPVSTEALRKTACNAGIWRKGEPAPGRPGTWTRERDEMLRRASTSGATVREVAAQLGVGRSCVNKRLRRLGIAWQTPRPAWLTPERAALLRELAATRLPWPQLIARVTEASPEAPPLPIRTAVMQMAARLRRELGGSLAKRRRGRAKALPPTTWADVLAWAAERDPDGDWVLRGSRAQRLAQVNEVRALEGLRPFVLEEDADARA